MDFLDEAGEWHYNPVSRDLYVIPPTSVEAHSNEMGPLVLTQVRFSLLIFDLDFRLFPTDLGLYFDRPTACFGSRGKARVWVGMFLTFT